MNHLFTSFIIAVFHQKLLMVKTRFYLPLQFSHSLIYLCQRFISHKFLFPYPIRAFKFVILELPCEVPTLQPPKHSFSMEFIHTISVIIMLKLIFFLSIKIPASKVRKVFLCAPQFSRRVLKYWLRR